MNGFTVWGSLALTAISVILVPLLILLFRIAIGATRLEDKVAGIEDDLKALVADKDKTHAAMLSQMNEDRKATNVRLRWLEENAWGKVQRRRTQPNATDG